MKNLKFIFILLFAAMLSSCENEPVIYGGAGSVASGKGYLSFSSQSYSLPIVINDVGSLSIPVYVSTLANVDRTFAIEVVDEGTTLVPGSVNIPSSVTIPANSYEGTLQLDGTDVPGVDVDNRFVVLRVLNDENTVAGPNTTVAVFQSCPVPSDYFVGDYSLSNLTTLFTGRPNFTAGTVSITAPTETTRRFSSRLLNAGGAVDVNLSLVCNQIFLTPSITTSITCAQGAVTFEPGTTPNAYDLTADDFFIINFDIAVSPACSGNSPFNQTFLLTKI